LVQTTQKRLGAELGTGSVVVAGPSAFVVSQSLEGFVRRVLRSGLPGLLLLLLPLVHATPAYAYDLVANVTPVTMVESSDGDDPAEVRARLHLGVVAEGTYRNLRGEIVVGNARAGNAAGKVAIGHKITCQPVGGSTLPNTATQQAFIWNSRNLLPDDSDKTMVVRMLFRPAVTGDYECLLRVYVNDGLSQGRETASLRSGFLGQIDGTIGPAGVAQVFGPNGALFFPLGGAGKQIHAVEAYTPLPDATSFLATSDVYATSCYATGGNACPTSNYPTSGTAQVRHRIVATPSSTEPGCVAQSSPSDTTAVTKDVHHLRIMQQIVVTLPATGCGTWRVNAFVQADGGNLPFVIHGGPYSGTYVRPPIA
jgi:hypothetical protein